MINLLKKYARKTFPKLTGKNFSTLEYWEHRAKLYGRQSVVNIGHSDTEFELITEKQKQEIFPYLRQSLRGDEQLILDFGCGCGRFTTDLAFIIGGKAIGIEPIKSLLDIAPQNEEVEYKLMKEGEIPLPDNYVDVVWICLVLGGIKQEILENTTREVIRVLKNDGLLFLVENTSDKPNTEHWIFRKILDYQEMFPSVSLVYIHDYFDLNERISILSGRKIQDYS
jgi:SAM-dependent methyltransferase